MTLRRMRIGLPLLVKELVEQSARRRTYVLRVVYACLLYSIAFYTFSRYLSYARSSPFAVLGHGREIFETVVWLQFCGIFLFMPAICCGVITSEKERSSLGLLFLTRLGPWTIIFEKLLGRLVPMLMFLLLSLPLLAFAYSLGGISQNYLWGGIWSLLITALQVGALAVMCSSFFRTTVAAFIACYIFGLTMYFFLPICNYLLWNGWNSDFSFMFFGSYLFFEHAASESLFPDLIVISLPILVSTFVFIVLARVFLVSRAFVQPRHLVLNFFRNLDRFFWKLNQNKITRGIVLIKQDATLPQNDPVAWRETTKKPLGTVRYLFRILLVIQIPLAFVFMLISTANPSSNLPGVSTMLFLLWFLAILLVSAKSASLISGERSHQTLDTLMTTPMSSREIIQQKFQGVRRLIWVLFVPFLTIYLFESWWKDSVSNTSYYGYGREFRSFQYLVCSVLSFVIYVPMIAWLSLLIGLRVRSQTRAILGSLAAIVAWCVLPFFLLIPISSGVERDSQSGFSYLFLFSPATIVPLNEFNELNEFWQSPWTAVIMNFVIYSAALFALRYYCLMNADRHLGRGRSW